MIVKVKLGDVFYINWFYCFEAVYKLYHISYGIMQAHGVCLENCKIRKASFTVHHIENNKIMHLDLGNDFKGEFKVLPKLRAMLYVPTLDEYWSKIWKSAI